MYLNHWLKTFLYYRNFTAASAAASADVAIQNNIFKPGMTTLIIWNKEMDDIIKIGKSLKESGLLTKGISGTIKNEANEQRSKFLGIFLGKLGSSVLGNMLTHTGVMRVGEKTIREG